MFNRGLEYKKFYLSDTITHYTSIFSLIVTASIYINVSGFNHTQK